MATEIAALVGLPVPKVSNGSTVISAFLDDVLQTLSGEASGASDTYRKTEALLDWLGVSYDPFWDTSERAPKGGSTVTVRAYSRMRTALTGTPRCFILNVTDAPAGTKWEVNHEEVYRYDDHVSGRMSLNDAGPDSRIIYYSTSKSSSNAKCFIAAATVTYIAPGRIGPWEARLGNYAPFPTPVPVGELLLPKWNHLNAITEVTFQTYQDLLAAGSAESSLSASIPITDVSGGYDYIAGDAGAAEVATRLLKSGLPPAFKPRIEIPDSLPTGVLTGKPPSTPTYSEDDDGVWIDNSVLVGQRSRNPATDRVAEQLAIRLAIEAFGAKGWELGRDRQKDGVGYDLEFRRGDALLKVEVKGIKSSSLVFNLTPKELWRAENDDAWVLVAVTNVLSGSAPKLAVLTRDRIAASEKAITNYRIRP